MDAKPVLRYSSRHAPCFVGSLDGDLSVMAELIQQSAMHRNGDEFVLWADADGYVFVSPDTTRAARQVMAREPHWVVNNYRARFEVNGVRMALTVEAIIEDLEYHRDERAMA